MSVSVKRKKLIIERDGGVCQINLPGCTVVAQTTDHRANRQAGGAPILDHGANLIAACSICNGHKADASGRDLARLERKGIYVRHASTHSRTLEKVKDLPVRMRYGKWYILNSDTERTEVEHASWLDVRLGIELHARQVCILARVHGAEVAS